MSLESLKQLLDIIANEVNVWDICLGGGNLIYHSSNYKRYSNKIEDINKRRKFEINKNYGRKS
jgi:hypothetical protein